MDRLKSIFIKLAPYLNTGLFIILFIRVAMIRTDKPAPLKPDRTEEIIKAFETVSAHHKNEVRTYLKKVDSLERVCIDQNKAINNKLNQLRIIKNELDSIKIDYRNITNDSLQRSITNFIR